MNTKIKDSHEVASIARFLTLYNDLNKSNLTFLRPGDPNKREPDGICSNDIAIELVGAYDNSYQASKIWGTARGKDGRAKPELRLLTFENLTREVATKLEKLNNGNYDGFTGKIVLLCNLHSPLLTDSDVDTFMYKYIPFKTDHYFDRLFEGIWITWRSEKDGTWKIKLLE